ncbi:MAG: DUF2911 domain-containing protein [Balneolaceae bacterium]|nr:DUF2911 domain-containing protein [Balneolaceae bacterium]
MRKITYLFLSLLVFGSLACQNEADDTETERRKSPIAIAKVNHNNTYVKVVYGQPYMRGREIFGELVPYSDVWRTGANEATELTTTRDILFAGNPLEAGTYALFTIPQEDQWTIILNSQLGQWGAFDYNSEFDVMRVDVNAQSTEITNEAFTIQFGEVADDSTSMIMRWENTEVRVPVEFMASPETES